MSDITRAEVRYEDRDRRLTFTWPGGWDAPVQVLEQGEKPLAVFDLPDRLSAAAHATLTTEEALELFQLACLAWRPSPELYIEPKVSVPLDAFQQLEQDFERATEDPMITRGQLWASIQAFLDGVPQRG